MSIPANAPAAARAAREALHRAEVALRDQREAVARMRRALPRDIAFEDLPLEEMRDGRRVRVDLSGLFEDPDRPLVLMHFMYGKAQTEPCPMCTLWADGYAGLARHLAQRVNFAVLIAGDVDAFSIYAKGRGWDDLRVVSAAETTLERDLGFEDEEGNQRPGVSVFERAADGSLTHFYSLCAYGPDGGRMMDALSPFWNFLDLTPEGRGDFLPRLTYDRGPL